MITGGVNIPRPFGLSLFENQLYWSDYTKMGLLRVDKMGGPASIKQIYREVNSQPGSVRVYHPSTQATNMRGNWILHANMYASYNQDFIGFVLRSYATRF